MFTLEAGMGFGGKSLKFNGVDGARGVFSA
jgi:hypothetical protein